MIRIYHNPRCKKSRAGLQALEHFTSDFEIKLYLKDQPFSLESLSEALKKLNKKPEEIIRKQEAVFKSDYKGKSFSDQEWIKILVENPKLIQRPIIIKDDRAVIGDPAENVSLLF
jgi:arsenate reductase